MSEPGARGVAPAMKNRSCCEAEYTVAVWDTAAEVQTILDRAADAGTITHEAANILFPALMLAWEGLVAARKRGER